MGSRRFQLVLVLAVVETSWLKCAAPPGIERMVGPDSVLVVGTDSLFSG